MKTVDKLKISKDQLNTRLDQYHDYLNLICENSWSDSESKQIQKYIDLGLDVNIDICGGTLLSWDKAWLTCLLTPHFFATQRACKIEGAYPANLPKPAMNQ